MRAGAAPANMAASVGGLWSYLFDGFCLLQQAFISQFCAIVPRQRGVSCIVIPSYLAAGHGDNAKSTPLLMRLANNFKVLVGLVAPQTCYCLWT